MKHGLSLLALIAVALAQTPASPFQVDHFSATMVMAAGPAAGMSTKVYKAGSQFRSDMPNGGYTVADLAAHKVFMVMPTGMCMEMPVQMSRQPNPFDARGEVTIEPLGNETLDGHACRVERVTVTTPGAAPQTMKVWSATDLQGFPLRVEMEHQGKTMQFDYKDVSLAAPDASLFAEPANCRKMPGMPGQ